MASRSPKSPSTRRTRSPNGASRSPRERERVRVPVDAEQPHARAPREERLRVAARADRRVHEEAAALGREPLDDFVEENGRVRPV